MAPNLEKYISGLKTEFELIHQERKVILGQLAEFIRTNIRSKGKADLIFICTHNSRRSHMSQVWAQVAAHHYGIRQVNSYSGGTEATAMFHMAAYALSKAGIEIKKLSEGNNPVHSIKYHPDEPAIIGFSKKYSDSFNPQAGYAAIITCTDADTNCPIIPEAAQRISLPFNDPKAFDGTPQQEEKYVERCQEIAREMFYAFSLV